MRSIVLNICKVEADLLTAACRRVLVDDVYGGLHPSDLGNLLHFWQHLCNNPVSSSFVNVPDVYFQLCLPWHTVHCIGLDLKQPCCCHCIYGACKHRIPWTPTIIRCLRRNKVGDNKYACKGKATARHLVNRRSAIRIANWMRGLMYSHQWEE